MDQGHFAEKLRFRLVALAIIGLTVAAYCNSLRGPFIYDDKLAILVNPTLRTLWPLTVPLSPPSADGTTVGGRPLLNLSFAVNYAIGRSNVFNYHVTNLLIQVLAGLVLFSLIYRAIRSYPYFKDVGLQEGPLDALLLAGSIALLWSVHPLATESVTYIVQRAESLAGLFFFLTLYCFIRATAGPKPGPWLTFSVLAALLGAATKEILATVPFVVFLFDRTFVAGSFPSAWQKRRGYYLSFLLVWVELGLLLGSTGFDRGGSIGFGVNKPWWEYSMTQFEAITRYVGLGLWPTALVFDYGQIATPKFTEIIPYVAIVTILVGATVWALFRRPALGFFGAMFFIVLAPTSSVIPGASQMIVEHRTYVSLAALIALVIVGLYAVIGRATAILAAGIALVLAFATYQRNKDYVSEGQIWLRVTQDFPANGDAWNNLGSVYIQAGNLPKAREALLEALTLNPNLVPAYYNLGKTLFNQGDITGAIRADKKTIELRPSFPEAHNNLGVAYLRLGEYHEALIEFNRALELGHLTESLQNKGIALSHLNQDAAAIETLNQVLRTLPNDVPTHNLLGNLYLKEKHLPQAKAEYDAARAVTPHDAAVNANLGNLCLQMDRPDEAIPYYLEALKDDPSRVDVTANLGNAYIGLGHPEEALAFFLAALSADPRSAATRFAYSNALMITHRYSEAQSQLEQALAIRPDFPEARARLDQVKQLLAAGAH